MKGGRVAIIGGGPGGLMLARVLQTRGVAATVFEREGALTERSQGGTLDMHPETGQFALKLAGLEAEFRRVARPEDQGFRIYDPAGTLHFAEDGGGGWDRPEVDRVELRRLLLDSLAPGVVRWGHKLRAIEPRGDGTHEVAFGNGESGRYDLVVGADGGRSRVRPLVSAATPSYSGITFVELNLDDADARHPAVAAVVGRGLMFALGGGKTLVGQRNGHGRICVYAVLTAAEDWVAAHVDPARPAAVKATLLAYFAGWAPELLALIREAGDRVAPWSIRALPVGHRWAPRPGVTLIGDAAHLMPPAGEGANLALRDAADLAVALADSRPADWPAAVAAHEAIMFDRAAEAAAGAAAMLRDVFGPDGLDHMLQHSREHHQPA